MAGTATRRAIRAGTSPAERFPPDYGDTNYGGIPATIPADSGDSLLYPHGLRPRPTKRQHHPLVPVRPQHQLVLANEPVPPHYLRRRTGVAVDRAVVGDGGCLGIQAPTSLVPASAVSVPDERSLIVRSPLVRLHSRAPSPRSQVRYTPRMEYEGWDASVSGPVIPSSCGAAKPIARASMEPAPPEQWAGTVAKGTRP